MISRMLLVSYLCLKIHFVTRQLITKFTVDIFMFTYVERRFVLNLLHHHHHYMIIERRKSCQCHSHHNPCLIESTCISTSHTNNESISFSQKLTDNIFPTHKRREKTKQSRGEKCFQHSPSSNFFLLLPFVSQKSVSVYCNPSLGRSRTREGKKSLLDQKVPTLALACILYCIFYGHSP